MEHEGVYRRHPKILLARSERFEDLHGGTRDRVRRRQSEATAGSRAGGMRGVMVQAWRRPALQLCQGSGLLLEWSALVVRERLVEVLPVDGRELGL